MSKSRFILLWLCSAAVVTLVRAFHAAELGYDLTLQIQAAQNLLEGNGLTIYSLEGEDDLARPNKLVPLTHFPAGYSFFAAALLAMGFSVAAVLKVWGAAGTILGWWGWAKLGVPLFQRGLGARPCMEMRWLCRRHLQPVTVYSALARHRYLSVGRTSLGPWVGGKGL